MGYGLWVAKQQAVLSKQQAGKCWTASSSGMAGNPDSVRLKSNLDPGPKSARVAEKEGTG
jgi:hypothetical protein